MTIHTISSSFLLLFLLFLGACEGLPRVDMKRESTPFPRERPVHSTENIEDIETLLQRNRLDSAMTQIRLWQRRQNLSPDQEQQLLDLTYQVHNRQGQGLEAARTLNQLSRLSKDPRDRQKYSLKLIEFIEKNSDPTTLEKIAQVSAFQNFRALAALRAAYLYLDFGDERRAIRLARFAANYNKNLEISEEASHFVSRFEGRTQVEAFRIGVVLPLSGRQAAIGQRALQGIQHGLGLFSDEKHPLELAIRDSEGNPETAREAINSLAIDDRVVAIVGALTGRTAQAEVETAQELGVPIMALAQRSGLTSVGSWVFQNSLTSQNQISHLVKNVMESRGMRNFAILYPNDSYGVEFANQFWDQVDSKGGRITAIQAYSPDETDFQSYFLKFLGLYYTDDRKEEFEALYKQWEEEQGGRRQRSRSGTYQALLRPVLTFDAIFIPDQVRTLGQVVPLLSYHQLDDVVILGTNLMNTPSLIERGQRHIEGALFVDGLFPSESFLQGHFFKDFSRIFGTQPGFIEVQAFDTAWIFRHLILNGAHSRDRLRNHLSRVSRIHGALGEMKMSQNREVLRPVTLLTVKRGQIQEVSTP